MTVLATRNVSYRIRGFLSSCMLEIAPGVYSAPRISPAVRERIWQVLQEWWHDERDASVVMVWHENMSSVGQTVRTLGSPPVELVEVDGLVLTRRPAEPAREG